MTAPTLRKVLARDVSAGMRVWARKHPAAAFEPGEVVRVEWRRTESGQRMVVAAIVFDSDPDRGWWTRHFGDIRVESHAPGLPDEGVAGGGGQDP